MHLAKLTNHERLAACCQVGINIDTCLLVLFPAAASGCCVPLSAVFLSNHFQSWCEDSYSPTLFLLVFCLRLVRCCCFYHCRYFLHFACYFMLFSYFATKNGRRYIILARFKRLFTRCTANGLDYHRIYTYINKNKKL